MKKRVDIYTRLSDEDRHKKDKSDDSESIANQKSMLLKYALAKDWEVINIYSDDDYSGADINRPQFQKLLSDCENGLVDIVLCKTQSRFSRDMEVIEKYIHNKFLEWNVRFVSVVDNADTEVEGNKKSRQINGLVNEWYLEDLSQNVRRSLQNKREDGQYVGSFAPYGYIKDPKDKHKLIIDPVASAVVKEIFEKYKDGEGYYRIAMDLNEKGVQTPSNYKKANGSKYVCACARFKEKTKWSQDTIYKILRSEVYIGNLVQGIHTYVSYKNHKQIIKPKEQWCITYGSHEPIIDIETWKFVQDKIKKRVRISKSTGEIYVLSKKIYCMECGSIFTRQLYHTKDGKTPYMKCKGHKLASRDCNNKSSIRCDIIEKYILDEINHQLDIYYNESELKRYYLIEKNVSKSSIFSKRTLLKQEKEKIENMISQKNEYYRALYEDKVNGIISQKEFSMLREKYSNEIEECKKRIVAIDEELSTIKGKDEEIISSKNIFDKYRHIDKLTREIVEEFIDVIKIGKVDEETHTRDINIYLKVINLD